MSHHKRSRRANLAHGRSLSMFEAELMGVSEKQDTVNRKREHKNRQLCRQVERTITMALAGECGDEMLRDVMVANVEPAGSSGQLIVHIWVPAGIDQAELSRRLECCAGRLRHLVAGAISRKRVPNLAFICLRQPAGEGGANA